MRVRVAFLALLPSPGLDPGESDSSVSVSVVMLGLTPRSARLSLELGARLACVSGLTIAMTEVAACREGSRTAAELDELAPPAVGPETDRNIGRPDGGVPDGRLVVPVPVPGLRIPGRELANRELGS